MANIAVINSAEDKSIRSSN